MSRKLKLIDKEDIKRSAGKCLFCPENRYAVLDVHRIKHGADGGRYTDDNTVVLCSVCHRLVHDGHFKIDRWYLGSNGKQVLLAFVGPDKVETFFERCISLIVPAE